MKIAINAWFIDRPTTGSGQYLTHLLTEYAADPAGHTFLLCGHAYHRQPEVTGQLPACFEWQTRRTPFDRLYCHLAKLWFEQVSFPRACRRWGADLVHVPYWGSPLRPPAPTVVTVHDLIPLLLPAYGGGTLGKWYTRLVSLSARRAARVLTDSEAARQDIVRHLRIHPDRVQAIHLAAEERFRPVDAPDELARVREKYGLPGRYLLYLGPFDARKNVPSILRAFARLDASDAGDLRLVIAGRLPGKDSDFFPSPRRIAAELGIRDRVCLTGWIDEEDKPALYSGAIAFVFPSHYEGFGLPPLEAMSCGTPVIVSDRSSLPEIVGPGGLCVDPDDLDALTDAMRCAITDLSLYEGLRAASLAQSRQFKWKKTASETMSAYDQARRATPPP
jgi:glycosyltransferase involved in cell wall biosynthesis